MGERYDALLRTDNPGLWQAVAASEDKPELARALLRYDGIARTSPLPAGHLPPALSGGLLSYPDLRSRAVDSFPDGLFTGPDRVYRLALSGGMGAFDWMMGGRHTPRRSHWGCGRTSGCVSSSKTGA